MPTSTPTSLPDAEQPPCPPLPAHPHIQSHSTAMSSIPIHAQRPATPYVMCARVLLSTGQQRPKEPLCWRHSSGVGKHGTKFKPSSSATAAPPGGLKARSTRGRACEDQWLISSLAPPAAVLMQCPGRMHQFALAVHGTVWRLAANAPQRQNCSHSVQGRKSSRDKVHSTKFAESPLLCTAKCLSTCPRNQCSK